MREVRSEESVGNWILYGMQPNVPGQRLLVTWFLLSIMLANPLHQACYGR